MGCSCTNLPFVCNYYWGGEWEGKERIKFGNTSCMTKSKDTFYLIYLLTLSLQGAEYYLKKLTVPQLIKKYPAFFMEYEGSSPRSQKPSTGPYLEPAESSLPHRSLSP